MSVLILSIVETLQDRMTTWDPVYRNLGDSQHRGVVMRNFDYFFLVDYTQTMSLLNNMYQGSFWVWAEPMRNNVTFSGYGLSQWKTTLHCNVVSHWLSPYQEWSLCISQWKCMPYHSTSLGLPHTSPSLQTTPGAILRWHSSLGAVFVMANTSGTTLTTAYHIEALTHGAFWPILLRKLTQVYLHPKQIQ